MCSDHAPDRLYLFADVYVMQLQHRFARITTGFARSFAQSPLFYGMNHGTNYGTIMIGIISGAWPTGVRAGRIPRMDRCGGLCGKPLFRPPWKAWNVRFGRSAMRTNTWAAAPSRDEHKMAPDRRLHLQKHPLHQVRALQYVFLQKLPDLHMQLQQECSPLIPRCQVQAFQQVKKHVWARGKRPL